MSQAPGGAAYWLGVLDFYISLPKEIAIFGDRGDPATGSLVEEVFSRYLPNKVVVGSLEGVSAPVDAAGEATASAGIPLLEGRGMIEGSATAYVCQNYVCQLPVTEAAALAEQLNT